MSQVITPVKNLLAIDSQVSNWQSLATGIGTDTRVLILDSGSDGLSQISDYLTISAANTHDFVPLQSLQIISHGSAGSLQLGSSKLTTGSLKQHTSQLAIIGNSLAATGDILLYGCDVAAGQSGLDFINQFAALTKADVAASTDVTGSAALGGDWQLEAGTGAIEAASAVSANIQTNYAGSLAVPVVTVTAGITPVEGAAGSFIFSLDSPAPAGGLTINYTVSGSATLNTDYTVTAGANISAVTNASLTIAEGQTTAKLTINAAGADGFDPNETIDINLATGSGYSLPMFDPKMDFDTGSNPHSISVGDFNGDGKTDLAVTNYGSNTVSVLLRNAANTGFDVVDVATGSNPFSISVGDFNGDGKTDLAVTNQSTNTISVLLRNAANTGFERKVDVATGLTPQSISAGDFNGDGKTDLAVANFTSDTVSVLLRNASNTGFEPKVDVATGSNPTSISIGDFNGDGKTDLAVANFGSYNNSVSVLWRNAANTGFEPKVDFATGSNPYSYPSSISLGDFDGDGKVDLAVTNEKSNTVSVLLGNLANTGFDPKMDFATGSKPGSISVGDFNGDGKVDLAVTNEESNTVSVLLRNAANTGFERKVDVANGLNPASVSVGDFDGDGKTDLAVANWNSGTVSVLLNNTTPDASLTITDRIPLTIAPTLTAFAAIVASGNEDSPITVTFANLKAQGNESDSDGTVTAFVVKAVSIGTLKIGTSAGAATAWNAGTNNSIDATHQAFWTPAANANGTLNAFTAVAKDNDGLLSATAVQAKVAVTSVNDAPTGNVSITGTTKQGQILTASNTLADVDGLGAIAYQWQAGGNNITGATKAAYTLTQTDVGKAITVKAGYTDGQGTHEIVSSKATSQVISSVLPGVSFTNASNLVTKEAGDTASFGVALKTAPHHDVLLTLTLNDSTEGQFAGNQKATIDLTFTATNWNQVQMVSLKGVDDMLVDGDMSYIISTKVTSDDVNYDGMRSGNGLAIANIVVINNDDDAADVQYGDKTESSNDYLQGGNGASDLYGKDGRDELHGGNADDRLYGGYGDDVLYGDAGNDQLEGEQGDDKLNGGDGNDTLTGGTGNDKLAGGNGNDSLDGSSGADTMDGGNGADTYYVDNALDVVSDSGTDVGVDTVNIASYISSTFKYVLGAGIENALLTEDAKDADLTGNLSNNSLNGNSFDNLMDGGAGIDTLNGGAGNDNLAGGLGNDKLLGGVGADSLAGGDGADQLNGGTGNDNLSGGNGSDTALFGTDNSTINLTTGKAVGSTEGTDTLSGIEIIDAGAGNDSVTGAATADTLLGGLGNDNVSGAAGNDILTGGNGTDKLTGGAGTDTFDFNALIESIKGTTRDSITDFTHSQADKIDLAGIDANSKVAGDQGFTYIGIKAFTGVAGQLDYFNGILAGDTNGDKVADFEIAITLVGATALISADFVL